MAVKMEKREVAETSDRVEKKASHEIMLGNGCKRYAYKGQVYEAGIKYKVSAERKSDLFGRSDDNGVRYFYDAEVVERQVKAQIQRKRKSHIPMEVSPAQYANIMTEVLNEQEDETVELRDSGNAGDTGGDDDPITV